MNEIEIKSYYAFFSELPLANHRALFISPPSSQRPRPFHTSASPLPLLGQFVYSAYDVLSLVPREPWPFAVFLFVHLQTNGTIPHELQLIS